LANDSQFSALLGGQFHRQAKLPLRCRLVMCFRKHVAQKPAVLRVSGIEIAGARHFRCRVMRPPHPHVRLRQIIVQGSFLWATGDCLLEKWYAFCESGLLEYRNS